MYTYKYEGLAWPTFALGPKSGHSREETRGQQVYGRGSSTIRSAATDSTLGRE
jgi:hypothetical protein